MLDVVQLAVKIIHKSMVSYTKHVYTIYIFEFAQSYFTL